MQGKTAINGKVLFGAAMVASLTACIWAQSTAPTAQNPASASSVKPAGAPYRNQPARVSNRMAAILDSVWGIDSPKLKAVESGMIVRFSYTVLDPQKAKVLSDKRFTPYLESEQKHLQLVVPSMEKVGQLRQAPREVETGQSYWMAFSNPGRQIKPGDRVDIVIGPFQVRGLMVE